MQDNQVHLWALGGCGSEIASFFESSLNAGLRLTYVDTSRSNIRDTTLGDEDIFIFTDASGKELDGSGKLRKENAKLIQEQTPSILNKHKAGKFNIVIFSLSGGSGSVAGPVLIANLLQRGESVAAVVVISFDDGTQTDNADRTFKGLMGAAEGLQRNVLVKYHLNGKDGKTEAQVNEDCCESIGELAILFSGENRRLDSADLLNFINYPRITGLPACVSELNIEHGTKWVVGNENPIAFCSLYPQGQQKISGLDAIYSCDGIVPESSPIKEHVTFTITTDRIAALISEIDASARRYDELKSARKAPVKADAETVAKSKDDGFLIL